jgi:hypothetical protein
MNETISLVISVLTTAGFSGFVGALFQARLDKRNRIDTVQNELKQKRYLCIAMLMLTKIQSQYGLEKITQFRPDLRNSSDIDNELLTELMNAFIFADQQVISSPAEFIENSMAENFLKVMTAMRRDLWNKNLPIDASTLQTIERLSLNKSTKSLT